MKFKVLVLGLILIFLLAACSEQNSEKNYDIDEIVANFNGNDITVSGYYFTISTYR